MPDHIRIAVATYTNTLPFLKGLQASSDISSTAELLMDYPSACAEKVIRDEADLGIIPIQALLDIPNYHIIGDYCIGSDGAVDSVFIFSKVPIAEVNVLRLDPQSKTSNGLARILFKYFWRKDIDVVLAGQADAEVLIGDRTFGQKEAHAYAYDLGACWKEFTGLPFAFAVWAANKPLPDTFEKVFNEALASGIEHMDQVIATLPNLPNFDFADYLLKKLDFNLTDEKRQAIARYLELYQTL
ncbi:menaquinone biosynthesis protein [Sphingobacterium sp. lm-10]|uniref:menaquinone biosynthetic enzyme MqnA/MqnD family protein n=1 Tax=Sphingobacterium sp. lm-10 TaxID=2944904 RepID=UPI00202283F6|nr:menaquinone biosynthesis protein [Sphingobacterium sp. lm-10]MCL7987176.1 menaquinone biosynthesis protein [Sphingobacterium sp. lm-10]